MQATQPTQPDDLVNDEQPDYNESPYQPEAPVWGTQHVDEPTYPATETGSNSPDGNKGNNPGIPDRPKPFREVLRDKRFWMVAPVLLLALGSTLYFLTGGLQKPQEPLISRVNVFVPNAQTDSIPKSKLELQAVQQRREGKEQLSANGMQTGISGHTSAETATSGLPTTLDPYLYQQKQTTETPGPPATDPELAAMDALYSPSTLLRPRPVPTGRSSGRSRSMPAYVEAPLPDELGEESGHLRTNQKQVDDRQRLLALLAEYKRDKEAKAAAASDGERPRKAESGAVISRLGETGNRRWNGFYGLHSADQKGQQEAALTEDLGTIRAVIHRDQQITDGGRVQLRLLEPVTIRGINIPANTLIFGMGSFGAERVSIGINNLHYEGRIFPIKLTVHDMDGMPGVFVPNVLAAQEGKQLMGQALGGANVNINGASATNARTAATLAGISVAQSGLSGARGVLQRRITQQKATLKGNYYVLLK